MKTNFHEKRKHKWIIKIYKSPNLHIKYKWISYKLNLWISDIVKILFDYFNFERLCFMKCAAFDMLHEPWRHKYLFTSLTLLSISCMSWLVWWLFMNKVISTETPTSLIWKKKATTINVSANYMRSQYFAAIGKLTYFGCHLDAG